MTYSDLLAAPISVISQMEIVQGWRDRVSEWDAMVEAGRAAAARAQGRRRYRG